MRLPIASAQNATHGIANAHATTASLMRAASFGNARDGNKSIPEAVEATDGATSGWSRNAGRARSGADHCNSTRLD
jgi:hypothetical protein